MDEYTIPLREKKKKKKKIIIEKENDTTEYNYLLQRLYDNMTNDGIKIQDEMCKFVKPIIKIEKMNKIVIVNFNKICNSIKRSKFLLSKYISESIGKCTIVDDSLIIRESIKDPIYVIESSIKKYIKHYVLCKNMCNTVTYIEGKYTICPRCKCSYINKFNK